MVSDTDAISLLARAFPGCRVEQCAALSGGISARALMAELLLADGSPKRVVLRRPSRSSVDDTRRIVSAEYTLLVHCNRLGLRAPKPCFVDREQGALVLEYVEGAPELPRAPSSNMLRQMATELARLHAAPVHDDFGFLGRRRASAAHDVLETPAALDETLDEAKLRSVLSELWPFAQHNPDVLLHGDYWPGNLLWKDAELVLVIDWEESEVGDPLADVALSRLDLLWAFGEQAMQDFTEYYRAQTALDWSLLAHWELLIALRPMSGLVRWAQAYAPPPISRPDITADTMREGHRRFVHQALRRLGLQPFR